jgi:uncharacterized circularly permuted ATP-grasp superfamily protein
MASPPLQDYDPGGFFDEVFDARGRPRAGAEMLIERLRAMGPDEVVRRQRAAERALLHLGITFNVYGNGAGAERIFPFDVVPRVVEAAEWAEIERGLVQRVTALNRFVADVYGAQGIVRDGVVPSYVLESARSYRPSCRGLSPPHGVFCHVSGIDLVRDRDGRLYVLEDNVRCPSGVSYVLSNRQVLKQTFPQAFERAQVRPIDDYPSRLLDMLEAMSPAGGEARVVVLTPGLHNSAYFEHAYLAHRMGVELVEGRDLLVADERVYLRTTHGLERVDVIYRRLDDDFLDPEAFRADSLLGVPGLLRAYRAGQVALVNAPGTGVADDKVVYGYVPRMIEYYLGQEPILANVPTYMCWAPEDRAYVLGHLEELVVKAANESGGYGMLIGPHSTAGQREEFARRIQENPRNYIAQPTLALSRSPVVVDGRLEGRHVDLRPFVLFGREVYVLPGGLTRVALQKGSLVVNSSQGGGSKDTWVLSSSPRTGP